MTREELKEHCKKQIEMCEMWAKAKGENPSSKIYEEHKMILELLEQEPCEKDWRFYYDRGYAQAKRDLSCEDAISRQAVLEQTYLWSKDEFLRVTNPFDYLRKRINPLPPVTPPPKIGHWIPRNSFLLRYKCSECERESEKYNYCPNCGAKMEEGSENDNKRL